MGVIITMLNMKGGVGKTTSVINIASCLRDKGYKLLLIDLDAQANLTQGLAIDDLLEKTIYTLLRKEYKLEEVIIKKNGLNIIPSTIDLSVADTEFNSRPLRELMLKNILEPVKDDYDFIIIDCAPNLALLSINAIAASDYYLVPLQAEYFALRGLMKLIDTVDAIKEDLQARIKLLGVFLTRFNKQKTLSRDVQAVAKEELNDLLLEFYIRENIAISEAQAQGISIFEYDKLKEKSSNGADDYLTLTEELLNRLQNGR